LDTSRGISLQSNVAAGTTESPLWPSIVGVDVVLGDNEQRVTLHLANRRSEGVSTARDVF
jgi:hypothetical protein